MKTLNNNIQESYCSFEVSKLLKEKGFKFSSEFNIPYYNYLGVYRGDVIELIKAKYNKKDTKPYETIAAPTHALAIEWVRVNYSLIIESNYAGKNFNDIDDLFKFIVNKPFVKGVSFSNKFTDNIYYNSPQEATEAALLYVLNNLI